MVSVQGSSPGSEPDITNFPAKTPAELTGAGCSLG